MYSQVEDLFHDPWEMDSPDSPDGDQVYEFFLFCTTIKKLLVLIYKRNLQFIVFDSFISSLILSEQKDQTSIYRARYCAYGVLGMLEEWIARDVQETAEELTAMIQKEL